MDRMKLIALAAVLAIAIVVFGRIVTDMIIGHPLLASEYISTSETLFTLALQSAFAAIPMIVLAVRCDRRMWMWVVAVALTAATWAFYAWQIWRASLVKFAGGADIGLGLIMLAAPFLIFLVMRLLSGLVRRSSRELG